MRGWEALGSGLAGAIALTAVHESARRRLADAPRMDIYASRGIARSLAAIGREPPSDGKMYRTAMAGDILSNTLYYSLIGLGTTEGALRRGMLLGLAAGVGALVLPKPMGLGHAPSNRTRATQAMTVGWYFLGGLAAGAVYRMAAAERRSS